MVGVVTIGVLDRLGSGKTAKPRVLIGGVIATSALLVVNEKAPKVAVGFALISLITAATLAVQSEIETGKASPFTKVSKFVSTPSEKEKAEDKPK